MRIRISHVVISFIGSTAMLIPPASPAFAQVDGEELLEEIIVVGTRRQTRTLANTPVPVKGVEPRFFRAKAIAKSAV